ncbi:hypothetical protein BJ085DRAFT_13318 [Dimargaris cristalligena]|uniref:J domain-containing protein n=1 Tax=Dimargaris cristalligena TaxID=215637 RepID=A0A4P9ZYT0_9FUNG|nr:hypothetical protein BJ085DRAFT_13318 [Dimargaris cristalligena]|eukprot:RKP38843.1 hypothetical protein BJ085DRAFT_13318 [Dimargaris cristalligena]
MSAERTKICHYDLLGVSFDATSDELKKAYRQQALLWHPDKNPHRIDEATAYFAQIQSAYQVLSDPQERSWYDDHKDAILRGADLNSADPDSMTSGPTSEALMKYFSDTMFRGYSDSKDGFFMLYGKIFRAVSDEELRAAGSSMDPDLKQALSNLDFGQSFTHAKQPINRNDGSRHTYTLLEYYSFWSSFSTCRSFGWHEKYRLSEAPNRYVRRAMEKENRKLRESARKTYNDTVRSLITFVKKRDPRIQAWNAEQQELQRQREEEKSRLKAEAKTVRVKVNYQAPAWAQVDDAAYDRLFGLADGGEAGLEGEDELYCVVCDKAFKSVPQRQNHDRSKKHIKALQQMRVQLLEDDEFFEGGF